MHHVRVVPEHIETMPDVGSVQRAASGMGHIIERIGGGDGGEDEPGETDLGVGQSRD